VHDAWKNIFELMQYYMYVDVNYSCTCLWHLHVGLRSIKYMHEQFIIEKLLNEIIRNVQ